MCPPPGQDPSEAEGGHRTLKGGSGALPFPEQVLPGGGGMVWGSTSSPGKRSCLGIPATGAFTTLSQRGCRDLDTGRYAAALAVFRQMVTMRPDHAPSQHALATAYFSLGEIGPAMDHFRKSLRLEMAPKSLGAVATLAPFDPRMNHAQVLRCRKAWYASLLAPSKRARLPSLRRSSPRAILRIGYVSSFFHRANWMKPVWGLINHHNPASVEVHLFSDAPHSAVKYGCPKGRSIRLHNISGYGNDRVARLIAENQIDVLVDLNGFSKLDRLPLFLKRPAPLLVAWFNIFATSGMSCFDALIGDEWVVREEEERWYVEKVVKLPMSYLTFEVNYPVPEVQPPPCLRKGFLTFGSLASLYKINATVIEAWAAILRRCPASRLVLRNAQLKYQRDRDHTLGRFLECGISADRLTLLGPQTHYEFLRQYDAIDLALDTFPYNGGTTTIEAIWQGVPVLTFCGDRWIARTSASILSNAGLKQFVCDDLKEYIERAVAWGASPDAPSALRELRLNMRDRLRKSPVCDCATFAERMEEIYRTLWQAVWTDSGASSPARRSVVAGTGGEESQAQQDESEERD